MPTDANNHELHVGDTVLLTGTVVDTDGDCVSVKVHGAYSADDLVDVTAKCVQLRDKVFEPGRN